MEHLGPLVLKPHLAERVWGGGAFGLGIGEAWDLSVHPSGPSTVVGGPHDGATLAEVVDADLDAFGGPIDLLAKRLDCAENLSVQMHPTDRDPKTESWVILDAQPGAGVFHGFRRPLDRAEAEAAALDGSIMDLLAFHEVVRGDCVFVPAGTVHAIGAGLLLFELQQSSDTTFRLYDYGRGRELHLERGLEVAELGPSESNRATGPLSDGRSLRRLCGSACARTSAAAQAASVARAPRRFTQRRAPRRWTCKHAAMVIGGPEAGKVGERWFDDVNNAAWLLAAIAVFLDRDANGGPPDECATQVLVEHGLLRAGDDGSVEPTAQFAAVVDGRPDALLNAIRSTLSQTAGVAAGGLVQRWRSQGAETLLAQGRASAMAGRFLATSVVPTLGLAERFAEGAVLLDVGVGVAELASAFCTELPSARVVGLDPFPLAIELAHKTVAANGMADRIELREQGVEELSEYRAVDLAWLPAPFIPRPALEAGIVRVFEALRPGGWLVLPGTTIEPGVRGATARFQVAAAGGTAFTADERCDLLGGAGFADPIPVVVPPGAPEMWAARRDA